MNTTESKNTNISKILLCVGNFVAITNNFQNTHIFQNHLFFTSISHEEKTQTCITVKSGVKLSYHLKTQLKDTFR